MPGSTKNNWWRRITNRVGMWLTPINIVTFGTTIIGTTIEFFLIRNKANDPEWYGISKEHAEEIKPCLSEYMPKASWGEALSTLFLDNWWSWEIVGWACAIGMPILVMVIAFEKDKTYQRVRDMLYQRERERIMNRLDSHTAKNLISNLNTIFSKNADHISEYQNAIDDLREDIKMAAKNLIFNLNTIPSKDAADVSEYKEAIKDLSKDIERIKTCAYNIKHFLQETSTSIDQDKQQIPSVINEIIEQHIPDPDEENDVFTELDEFQNTISAKTVWRNSYKDILTITCKIGLNFSFLFFALYELTVGIPLAKKYRHMVPDILDRLKHDHEYEHLDKYCLDVISRAIAKDEIYNINAKLVSLLVPAIIILGVGAYVVLPKFIKWIRGSNNEEEKTRLIEDTAITYGTHESEQKRTVELYVLPQTQVLI